jgi:TrmH family RNA methyltransferase
LQQRKYRRRRGETIVEGRRAVASALSAGAPVVDLVVTPEALREAAVAELVDAATVPVYEASSADVGQLSAVEASQGLLAVVERRYVEVDTLAGEIGASGTVLALDGVQDPGNAGTILRTAAWFGVDAVVAGAGTAGLYGPKVMRAAMGGHWDLQLARTDALGEALDVFRKAGATLYGADLYGTQAPDWSPRRPSVLVLGSEAHGLSAPVLDRLDEPIAIPGDATREGTESLNVAVASGILVYEWTGRP